MREYMVTTIYQDTRLMHRVIADSSTKAIMISLSMLEARTVPLSVYCKPTERITA